MRDGSGFRRRMNGESAQELARRLVVGIILAVAAFGGLITFFLATE
jgi:hypothetical protein